MSAWSGMAASHQPKGMRCALPGFDLEDFDGTQSDPIIAQKEPRTPCQCLAFLLRGLGTSSKSPPKDYQAQAAQRSNLKKFTALTAHQRVAEQTQPKSSNEVHESGASAVFQISESGIQHKHALIECHKIIRRSVVSELFSDRKDCRAWGLIRISTGMTASISTLRFRHPQ